MTIVLRTDGGFSLVEVLLALTLASTVLAAMVGLANPAIQSSSAQAAAIDLQQRARQAVETLTQDLYAAGAGVDSRPAVGPFADAFPPVLPRRLGALGADSPDTAREDALTVVWAPFHGAQTELEAPQAGASMPTRPGPGCPPAPACGLSAGIPIVAFDTMGHADLFTITGVAGNTATVRHRGLGSGFVFDAGAVISQAEARTYYFDAARSQLRRYDTDTTDVPVIDNVVSFRTEYSGARDRPRLPRPPPGVANCLYDEAGQPRFPHGPDVLVPVSLAELSDGPWCGENSARFDVDLLRIRQIHVTLRLQAAASRLRGTGADYAVAGTSRSVWRSVPDEVVSFTVTPRNLNQ